MTNALKKKPMPEWIPNDLLGWLEAEACRNGRTVEMEILDRLEQSRQDDVVKKKTG